MFRLPALNSVLGMALSESYKNTRNRYRGSLLGLAVGDALGTTLEFQPPGTFKPINDMVGGGPFRLKPGQWTDDTSMALCLAESLLECEGFDPVDQMNRYVRWWKEGYWSSAGNCFDIGNTIAAALSRFIETGEAFTGSADPRSAGNGSIMRLAPVPLYYAANSRTAIKMAAQSSRITSLSAGACGKTTKTAAPTVLATGTGSICRRTNEIPRIHNSSSGTTKAAFSVRSNSQIFTFRPRENTRMKKNQIIGVDFSGAKDAGKKIWISFARTERETLEIESCVRIADLPAGGRKRPEALKALRKVILEHPGSIIGLDFPFGIPSGLVEASDWQEFVLEFGDRYQNEHDFREQCRAASQGKEWKRRTDVEAKIPFSPYNRRLFRQTYFGIRDVLLPLVRENTVSVLPMQKPEPNKPWLIEICPASTLKALGLKSDEYKGKRDPEGFNRLRLLGKLHVNVPDSIRSQVVEDSEGDVLDSVIAAFATHRALDQIKVHQDKMAQGYVYM